MERVTWGKMQNPIRGVLHGSAALVAAVGLAVLVIRAADDRVLLPGVALFGLALVAMFSISALYHSVPWTETWKRRMQRLDHSAIFVVVAATFTPLAFAALEGLALVAGLTLVWGIAVVGIVLKFALPHPRTAVSVVLQLTMGWSALIWMPWFTERLGWGVVALILAGGLCYTVGTIVYALHRPRLFPRTFGYHELFHVLVIGGAGLHYWAIAAVVA
ncbi:MAG TPA: hemolysin III family protein [Acidimicrobiia bacterium]